VDLRSLGVQAPPAEVAFGLAQRLESLLST